MSTSAALHRGRDASSPVVVVVEDDDSLRSALERLLRAAGFGTRGYRSAEDMLADAAASTLDALVVDLHLPAMDGIDLVATLRSRGFGAPAVAITAHDEARLRARARRQGIECFLAKPFAGAELVGAMRDLLRRGA